MGNENWLQSFGGYEQWVLKHLPRLKEEARKAGFKMWHVAFDGAKTHVNGIPGVMIIGDSKIIGFDIDPKTGDMLGSSYKKELYNPTAVATKFSKQSIQQKSKHGYGTDGSKDIMFDLDDNHTARVTKGLLGFYATIRDNRISDAAKKVLWKGTFDKKDDAKEAVMKAWLSDFKAKSSKHSSDEQVVQTILQQLGGRNKIVSMTGAKDFYRDGKTLMFKYPKSKHSNYIRITLNGKDLYDVEFQKFNNSGVKTVATHKDVYASDLKKLFEKTTGLYLSL